MERALATVLRTAVSLTVGGRTDAGVHAWGQVASYVGPPAPSESLNAVLPTEITVVQCEAAPAGFDARRDATSRTYCYRVLTRRTRSPFEQGRALWWPHRLDIGALGACADAVVGTHDLTAFTPTQTEHVLFRRTVLEARWESRGAILEFWIRAPAFLRHMNRVLVGTMLETASGRRSVADFERLLEGRPRSAAGPTAPAHGLYLAGVSYEVEPGRSRAAPPLPSEQP